MIASLMMYKRPQLVDEHKRYWGLIRKQLNLLGIDSPLQLEQDAEEFFVWKHPELVLSQTCGMPYRTWLYDKVELIGTPDYGIEDCSPGYYRSIFVVRKDDQRTAIEAFKEALFAYNQIFSQSGYAAAYWHVKKKGFWFENRLQMNQHLAAARAVAQNDADIACLDAISWRLMQQYEHFSNALRILEWTDPTPGLPLISAQGNNSEALFFAVSEAIDELAPEDRMKLGLKGIVRIPKEIYLSYQNP